VVQNGGTSVAYRFDLVAQQVEETEGSRKGCSPARKVLGDGWTADWLGEEPGTHERRRLVSKPWRRSGGQIAMGSRPMDASRCRGPRGGAGPLRFHPWATNRARQRRWCEFDGARAATFRRHGGEEGGRQGCYTMLQSSRRRRLRPATLQHGEPSKAARVGARHSGGGVSRKRTGH
jgi:hypothetical protein